MSPVHKNPKFYKLFPIKPRAVGTRAPPHFFENQYWPPHLAAPKSFKVYVLEMAPPIILTLLQLWVHSRAVGRFQILGGHTLSRVQIMTMKLVGTSTKSSKYWVGKCPCAHPVPTALHYCLCISKNFVCNFGKTDSDNRNQFVWIIQN